MYNPDYLNWGPQGWRCPSCNKIFSPSVSECPYCGRNGVVYTSGSTNPNDSKWWEEYLKKSQTGTPVKDEPSSATEMGQNLAELLRNAIGGIFND